MDMGMLQSNTQMTKQEEIQNGKQILFKTKLQNKYVDILNSLAW